MSIKIIDINDIEDSNKYSDVILYVKSNFSNDYLNELEYDCYDDKCDDAIVKISRKDYEEFKSKLDKRSWVYELLPKIYTLCRLGYHCFDDNGEVIEDAIIQAASDEYGNESIIFHSLVRYLMIGVGNYWFILYIDDGQFIYFDYKIGDNYIDDISELKLIELH